MSIRLGLELTFFPRKATFVKGVEYHEYLVKSEAEAVAKRFNRELWKLDAQFRKYGMLFVAKGDVFRNKHDQPHKSWIIEINNLYNGQLMLDWLCPLTQEFYTGAEDNKRSLAYQKKYHKAVGLVFKIARSLGLVARLEKKRNGKIVTFVTGGGHLHLSIDFFYSGADYFDKMKMLEKCLCLDFYNMPWLKWLFAEYSDDENSRVAHNITKSQIPLEQTAAHDAALNVHSIAQRFSDYGKLHIPTYEFRFFNAVKSVDELILDANFLKHWTEYYVNHINTLHFSWKSQEQKDEAQKQIDIACKPTLTVRRYKKLANLDYARGQMTKFFEKIGLDFKNYEAKFQENYVRRMKWGKML